MINDPADIEWLYTGLSTGSGQEIVGLSKTDYETVRAALESDTRRAKRAEAEAAALRAELAAARAQLDAAELDARQWRKRAGAEFEKYRNAEYWLVDLMRAHETSEGLVEQLRDELAAAQWRPNDDQALFEDKDIEGEIILTATFQQRNHCWNVDGISILPSGVVAWRPRTAAPDEEE